MENAAFHPRNITQRESYLFCKLGNFTVERLWFGLGEGGTTVSVRLLQWKVVGKVWDQSVRRLDVKLLLSISASSHL